MDGMKVQHALLFLLAWICAPALLEQPRGLILGKPSVQADDFDVQCFQRGVKVVIKKSRLIDSGHNKQLKFYFLDFDCESIDNGTHIHAYTSYDKCGTVRTFSGRHVSYTNEFRSMDPSNDVDVYVPCPVVALKFSCSRSATGLRSGSLSPSIPQKAIYCRHLLGLGPNIEDGVVQKTQALANKIVTKQRTISCPTVVGIGDPLSDDRVLAKSQVHHRGGVRVKSNSLRCRPLQKGGQFDIKLLLFTEPDFSESPNDKIFVLPSGKYNDVFYELRLETKDPFLTVFPTTCFATPSSSRNDDMKYTFLQDGCAVDETFRYHKTSSKSRSRFSITSFKFQNSDSNSFYAHCDVRICDIMDDSDFCKKGCKNNIRSKRRFSRRSMRNGHFQSFEDYLGFSRHCSKGGITVTIDKSYIGGLDLSTFTLNQISCRPSSNNTHLTFTFKPHSCGSVTINRGSYIEYKNVIHAKTISTISHRSSKMPELVVPFSCKFEKDDSHTPTSKMTSATSKVVAKRFPRKRHYLVKNAGLMFVFANVFFDTPVYAKKLPMHVNTVMDDNNTVLRVEVSTVPGKAAQLKHCKIGSSPHLEDYIKLITHSCPRNVPGFSYRQTPSGVSKMKINLNELRLEPSSMLMCTLHVCDSDATGSPCQRECPPRRSLRRSRRSSEESDGFQVDLQCASESMTISLAKSSLPRGYDVSSMHLLDPSCYAVENATHITLTATPTTCGTKRQDIDDVRVYVNAVLEDPPDQVIIRRKLVEVPFKCTYKMQPQSAGLSIRFAAPIVKFSSRAVGHYSVRIDMFTDDTYSKLLTENLVEVDPDNAMFFEVKLESKKLELSLSLDKCFGRPMHSTDVKEHYTFIKNGCSLDNTVKFHPSKKGNRVRFSLKPFAFSDDPSESIIINCFVSACDMKDTDSNCRKGCMAHMYDDMTVVH